MSDSHKNFEIEKREALVFWDPKQPDLEDFVLCVEAPGILPLKSSKPEEAKNGSWADVIPLKNGMDVRVSVKDAKRKKITIFIFKVVQFPSPVIKKDCHWKVEKDQITISLRKKEPIRWMPFIRRKGIDQGSSSSSSSSGEEEHAAAAAPKKPRKGVLRLDDLANGVKKLVIIERRSKQSDSNSSDDGIAA